MNRSLTREKVPGVYRVPFDNPDSRVKSRWTVAIIINQSVLLNVETKDSSPSFSVVVATDKLLRISIVRPCSIHLTLVPKQ